MSVGLSIPAALSSAPSVPQRPVWLADNGDGTYRNPVLFADYSDPDAIRVGEDFWLTASSFCHVPGLPILHSRDLVNWTLVNHALPQLLPVDHFSTPRHGQGVWAPALRHHEGKFWIYYPDPDFGLYAIHTSDPRGQWSDPVLVKKGKGLIDPCPFWDDDGQGYLIHGWAKSRSGIKNRLTLHRLEDDHVTLADEGTVIIDGDRMKGWTTIEGPKLYRRGNYYYVFAPAGGVAEGYQAVFRSRDLYGPYENRIVLARGSTAINGPHQGAWVDTPAGEHWFLHFQEMPVYGRVVHLQPMRWRDDWPVMGCDKEGKGTGEPVLVERIPRPNLSLPLGPDGTDDFTAPSLGLQWQWQGNPKAEWWSLRKKSPALRLRCVFQKPEETLWSASHLLMQKFSAPAFAVTTLLEFFPAADGEIAGLVVFGFSYALLALKREHGRLRLVMNHCENAHQKGVECEVTSLSADSGKIYLRVSVDPNARGQFSFSIAGEVFAPVGPLFQATSSYWVGAKVGLVACARGLGATKSGHVDVAWFRVTPLAP